MTVRTSQAGYSAIEVAVAVALAGVFMLIILWGIGLVDVGQTYAARRQFENTFAALSAFRDRWNALPGDDDRVGQALGRPAARSHRGTDVVDLTDNGRIDGALIDPASPEGEQYAAWRDLRRGGFYPGDPELIGLAALPETPFDGVAGFSAGAFGLTMPLCMTNVPGTAAPTLDSWLDDGVPDSGRMRGGPDINGPPAEGTYDPAATYTICAEDL